MGERDDFIRLMPNMQQQATRISSDNSQALKEYMAVLGDRVNIPIESGMHKDRREGLQYRYGTGRVAPKRHFTIKIRPEEVAAEEAATMADAARLDPEELKDALIQQAQAERRRVLQATLRQGTGRRPPKCSFQVVVRPFEPTPQPPPLHAAPGAIIPESQMAQFYSNENNTAGTGADGLSPMEGVPELRLAVNSSWTPSVAAAGMYHQQQQISSSPIKGVVSHAAAGNNNRALQPQKAPQQDFSFGGGYDDDDDYGGGDDFGGGYDDYGGGDDGGDGAFQDYGQPSPNQEGVARQPYLFGNNNTRMQMYQQDPSRPRPRRHILNPGIRLKNELPRKSFAYNASMGRQEVAPGIRRSTRRAKSPLRWWLNEVKVYGREHKTMPTVEENVKMVSGAIWRTAVDPLSKRGRIDHDFGGGAKRARTKSSQVAAAHDADDHEEEEGAASPSSSPAVAGRKRSKGGRSRRRNNNCRSRQSKQQQQSESAAVGGVDSENDSMMVDCEDVDNAVSGLSTVHEEEGEDGLVPGSAAAAAAAMPSSFKSSRGRPQPASSSEMGLFDMFEDTDIGDATTETNGAAAAGAKDDDDVDDGAVSQPAPVQEDKAIVLDREEAMQVGNGVVVDLTLQDAAIEEEEGQPEVDLVVVDEEDDGGLQELLQEELAALSPANALLGTGTANNALFSPAVEDDGELEEGEVGASPGEMVVAHVPAHGDEEFADDEALLEEEEVLEEEEEEEKEGEVIVSSGAGNGVEEVEVDVEEEHLPVEEVPMNDDEEEEEEEDVPSPIMGGDEKDEEMGRVNQQVVVEGEDGDGDEAIDSDAETVEVSPSGATGSMTTNGGGVTMRRSARR